MELSKTALTQIKKLILESERGVQNRFLRLDDKFTSIETELQDLCTHFTTIEARIEGVEKRIGNIISNTVENELKKINKQLSEIQKGVGE